MSVSETIENKLRAAFNPSALEIIDESHLHAGHAGHREGGESHFRIRMTSDHFDGMIRIQQHRAVNEVLAEELNGPVHALALELNAAS
ncbi:MAG: BolA family protein [Pseudomonadota bacterium]